MFVVCLSVQETSCRSAGQGRPRSLSPADHTATVSVQCRLRHGGDDHTRDLIPRLPTQLSLPLPPSIRRSADGEEGYSRYQRRLARFNRSEEARDATACFQPPPNRTVMDVARPHRHDEPLHRPPQLWYFTHLITSRSTVSALRLGWATVCLASWPARRLLVRPCGSFNIVLDKLEFARLGLMCRNYGVTHRKWGMHVLCWSNIGQFWKRSAWIIAVKGDYIDHCV